MNNGQNPARRLRHGQRPTEPVSFGDAGAGQQAAPADLQQLKALANLDVPGPLCALLQIAKFMDDNSNQQQTGVDTWDFASQFDYELGHAASEVRQIVYDLIGAAPERSDTPAPQWISVNDRLPPLYVTVAMLNDDRWMNTGSSDHSVNWHGAGYLCDFGHKCWSIFGETRSMCLDAVTHWMLMPELARIDGDKQGAQGDGA